MILFYILTRLLISFDFIPCLRTMDKNGSFPIYFRKKKLRRMEKRLRRMEKIRKENKTVDRMRRGEESSRRFIWEEIIEHHDAAMKIGGFEECVNAKNMLVESTDIL